MRPRVRPSRAECGALAGGEVLPLGFLLLVVAVLVITNGWAVLDARLAASAASREAARTAVESSTNPADAGTAAARSALSAFGYDAAGATITVESATGFVRCAPVLATVTQTVPAFRLPWVGGIGDVTVSARHREIVDPHRDDVPNGSCR